MSVRTDSTNNNNNNIVFGTSPSWDIHIYIYRKEKKKTSAC